MLGVLGEVFFFFFLITLCGEIVVTSNVTPEPFQNVRISGVTFAAA